MDAEKAQKAILEAMFFENWLRYHFLVEDPDAEASLKIPEAAWKKIKAHTPRLELIARELDQKPVSFENSRAALLTFLAHWREEENASLSQCREILLDPAFQEELENQQTWLSLHQISLPSLDFREWQHLYQTWKANTRLAEKTIFPGSGRAK